MSFSLKANWHLSVSLNNIEGYPVGSSNVFKISETTFLKESGLNLVLCENEKIVWKIIGNKGGKIPDCSETGIDGINTNSNFNPLFSSDRRYMAFESVGAGFLGSNRIFIIDLKDGTEKKYNGFDIAWSNAGNYLLYKSDRSGKYLILCVKNGKRINVKFDTAIWLTL